MSELSTSVATKAAAPARSSDTRVFQRKCDCGNHTVAGGQCDDCTKKEIKLQRKVSDQGATSDVPAAVDDVLKLPGQPLDAATRSFFEPRFGHDFSRVRVHTESSAVSRQLRARAFSYGHDLGFAPGEYVPHTAKGRWLLAHELAHVVQQSRGIATPQTAGEENDDLEQQADATADLVVRGGQAPSLAGAGPRVQRFPLCRSLLDAPNSGDWVAEASVRNAILNQRRPFGTVDTEFPIPAGSATPGRTEPSPRQRGRDVIKPQVVGSDILGRADIAQVNGTALELIEVKRAVWEGEEGVVFAESQLLNYVAKSNRAMGEVNRLWQGRGHNETLTSVRGMPSQRFAPVSPQRLDGKPVSISWCRDGVMAFKSMGDRDPEVFLCGVSDQGRINGFLDRVMDRAHAQVEEFVRTKIEGPAMRRIANRSLREAARFILSRPEVRQFVPPGLSDDLVIDEIVRRLQPAESIILAKATEMVERVVAELRRSLQAEVRNLLKASFDVLCAKAADMTARELLNEFEKKMRQLALQLIPAAVLVAARAMMQALLAELAVVLVEALAIVAAAVVVVIAAILLWEVAVAIVAAGAIETALAGLAEFVFAILAKSAFR